MHLRFIPAVVILLNHLKSCNSLAIDSDFCETEACMNYVKRLKSNMNSDTNVDPCVDFYEFNCGGFLKNTVLAKNASSSSEFTAVDNRQIEILKTILSEPIESDEVLWTRNSKNYYQSCINNENSNKSVEYALELINELGGWELLTGVENTNTPLDLIGKLYNFQYSVPIVFLVDTNPLDVLNRIIQIYQPKFIDYSYYEDESFISVYKEYFKQIVSYFKNEEVAEVNETVESLIDEMIEIEKRFAKIQLNRTELRTGLINVLTTVKQLQEKYPLFPWSEFIMKKMFHKTNITIDEHEPVLINDIGYLEKVHIIYDDCVKNQPRAFKNLLIGVFIYDTINAYLPEKFRKARLNVSKYRDGIEELPNLETSCVIKTTNALFNEVGRLYVKKAFTALAKEDVTQMANNILKTFKSMLENNTWMDEDSKAKALYKAKYLKPQVGYPDYYFDSNFISNNFQYVMESENLLKNAFTVLEQNLRFMINGKLREKVDRDYWLFSAAIVDAFYDRYTNQIYLPAGILTTNIYDPSLPKYLNYGAIGMFIGRGITQAFDDIGRKYDHLGRYIRDGEAGLWTNKTIDDFKSKSKCMVNQYNKYFVLNFNGQDLFINGEQTLGENIADNGGLKTAYNAYFNMKTQEKLLDTESNFTVNQLFFIGTAQFWCTKDTDQFSAVQILEGFHSVSKYRINGMMHNSKAFYDAFQCDRVNECFECTDCSIW